jgi:hypothetical protein
MGLGICQHKTWVLESVPTTIEFGTFLRIFLDGAFSIMFCPYFFVTYEKFSTKNFLALMFKMSKPYGSYLVRVVLYRETLQYMLD